MFTIPKKVTLRNVLDDYTYDGKDMGATFYGDNINLKLWAPTAYKVEALVYDSYGSANDSPSRVYPYDTRWNLMEYTVFQLVKLIMKTNTICIDYILKIEIQKKI